MTAYLELSLYFEGSLAGVRWGTLLENFEGPESDVDALDSNENLVLSF